MCSQPWRDTILQRLKTRNQTQRFAFESIIRHNNQVADEIDILRSKNLQLQVEVETLQKEKLELVQTGNGGKSSVSSKVVTALEQRSSQLEQKVFKQQEELTELHRKKGENSQQIIDLSSAVQEKNKELKEKSDKINDLELAVSELTACKVQLEESVASYKTTNQLLHDEQQALNVAFISLEQKFHKLQEDNNDLVSRWMQAKSTEVDKMNAENDKAIKIKQEKIRRELEEAAKEAKPIQEPEVEVVAPAIAYVVTVPEKAVHSIEAHDAEVNAVKWSMSGRFFATGGGDRKVKIWEVANGRITQKSTLIGSNSGIMSVEFDYQDAQVLAASCDFSVRIWSVSDQRLRQTLTGHSGKVYTAKFLHGVTKVVSGGHDRTLKLWDVRKSMCDRTLFAGSSCFDVVTSDSLASCVMSAHFDKRVRFWDMRSDKHTNDIILQGKVASLDLSPDALNLLCCSRDNSIQIIDLRMNQIVKSLTADGFHVGSDWSRAVFSPDGMYVVCGTQDGALYVWNVMKSSVEKILKAHSACVHATSWDPKGSSIVSADKNRTVVYWSGY